MESSGIDGIIPVPKNSTCLNSLKLSDPGVEISTDFRVSPSLETIPRRLKSEFGPLTPVKTSVPLVPLLSVQVTSPNCHALSAAVLRVRGPGAWPASVGARRARFLRRYSAVARGGPPL